MDIKINTVSFEDSDTYNEFFIKGQLRYLKGILKINGFLPILDFIHSFGYISFEELTKDVLVYGWYGDMEIEATIDISEDRNSCTLHMNCINLLEVLNK